MKIEPMSFKLDGGVASFDPPDLAEAFFRRTLREIGKRRRMDGEDRAEVGRHERDLRERLTVLRGIEDRATRDVALDAVATALSLGFHHRGGPGAAKEAEDDFNRKRVAPAHAARRKDIVKEIIERHTDDLRKRVPRFRKNDQGTAREILRKVVFDIRRLPEEPKGWETDSLDNLALSEVERKEARRKYLEKIRSWIRRACKVDN